VVKLVEALRVKDIETDTEREVKTRIYKRVHEAEDRNQKLVKEKKNDRRWFIGVLLTVAGIALTAFMLYLKVK